MKEYITRITTADTKKTYEFPNKDPNTPQSAKIADRPFLVDHSTSDF